MEISRINVMFISLNTFINKDTWEITYNMDIQKIYNQWTDKEYRKIEKKYLNNISEKTINELKKLEWWDIISLTENLV